MTKREKLLIIILVLIFAAGVIYFIFNEAEPLKDFAKETFSAGEKTDNGGSGITDTDSASTNTVTSSGGGGGGSSSSSASSGGSSTTTENSEIVLPEDLETQPCGFYSGEYGEIACGGYCEIGTCVTEGRSCYCKI